MLQLNYYIHILLHYRYKLLFDIFIFSVIVILYSYYLNGLNTIECMNQNSEAPTPTPSPTLLTSNTVLEHIAHIEYENIRLHDHINVLLRELRYNIEQRYADRAHYESTIQALVEENHRLRTHLAQTHPVIYEADRLLDRLASENETLRTSLSERESFDQSTIFERSSSSQNNNL